MRHTTEAPAKGLGGLLYMVGTEVCQLASLDVVPNSFGGIQVRGVPGEPFDLEPVPLSDEEFPHHLAAVGWQVIPDQDYFATSDEAFQFFEEDNQTIRVEAVRFGSG